MLFIFCTLKPFNKLLSSKPFDEVETWDFVQQQPIDKAIKLPHKLLVG